MTRFRKFLAVCLSASTLAVAMTAATPASAQWGGWGWGGGWGPGYGYGYNNGGAIAGAAIGGLALGALAGAAIAQQNQYAAQPYYAAPRRGRLCGAWQPIYDDWGNFLQYRRVKVAC